MIYFKKNIIENYTSQIVEKQIRTYTYRKHTFIDLQSSVSYIRDQQIFIGTEDKNNVYLTRIRSPFELFLPKVIICFNKKDYNSYRIRLSIFPFIMGIILGFILLSQIIRTFLGKIEVTDLFVTIILLIIFVILSKLEIFITERALNKLMYRKSITNKE